VFIETGAGRFRVPTLRNVAVTAPYMHDGRFASLGDVIDDYAAGRPQGARASIADAAPPDPRLRGFSLSAAEKADLLAFLESLTDREFLSAPRFGPP
jgi:cytochrome c peroxidase